MGGDTAALIDDDDVCIVSSRSFQNSDKSMEIADKRRVKSVYTQVFKHYDELKDRVLDIDVVKSKILSYTPGSWVENVGGMTVSDYDVPKTSTLLLIGPTGSGKSSLINRISRVFEDDKFAPERAQVTYNSHLGDGTCFLQEYMVPRSSTSFCLYDTRGFSNDIEDLEMVKRWMTRGVCHGELAKSAFNATSLQSTLKWKARQDKFSSYQRRKVNFVIFVVNGLSILKCLDSNFANTEYIRLVASIFGSHYVSFKDQKPAIVITHGDLLTRDERSRVRFYLGELFGVHPIKQMFDIPDNCEPTTELTIVDMVRYALEHADRNLPCKAQTTISKGPAFQLWSFWLLLLGVAMFICTLHHHGFHPMKVHPDLVPESGLKTKEFMEVRQSFPEPSLKMKEFLEVCQESVCEPSPKMKEFTEVHLESVVGPNLEIKKFPEIQPEIIPDMKKVMEEIIFKPSTEIKKDHAEMEEIFPKSSLEVKKDHPEIEEIVTKPSSESKEAHAEKEEIISKQRLEIKKAPAGMNPEKKHKVKKVPKIQPEIIPDMKKVISEIIQDMKKVMEEIIFKPISEIKKHHAERDEFFSKSSLEVKTNDHPEIEEIVTKASSESEEAHAEKEEIISKQRLEIKKAPAGMNPKIKHKVKKVPEPSLEIDWKKIRHLWYDE